MGAIKNKKINDHLLLSIFEKTVKVNCSGNALFFDHKIKDLPYMFIPSLMVILQDVFNAGKDAKTEEINKKLKELKRMIL